MFTPLSLWCRQHAVPGRVETVVPLAAAPAHCLCVGEDTDWEDAILHENKNHWSMKEGKANVFTDAHIIAMQK